MLEKKAEIKMAEYSVACSRKPDLKKAYKIWKWITNENYCHSLNSLWGLKCLTGLRRFELGAVQKWRHGLRGGGGSHFVMECDEGGEGKFRLIGRQMWPFQMPASAIGLISQRFSVFFQRLLTYFVSHVVEK